MQTFFVSTDFIFNIKLIFIKSFLMTSNQEWIMEGLINTVYKLPFMASHPQVQQ